MTRFLIAALATVLSTAASANISAIRIEGDTAHIGYSDLDLKSHAGRTELADRIRHAANRICALSDEGLQPLARRNDCYRVAVASGAEQMERLPDRSRATEFSRKELRHDLRHRHPRIH